MATAYACATAKWDTELNHREASGVCPASCVCNAARMHDGCRKVLSAASQA